MDANQFVSDVLAGISSLSSGPGFGVVVGLGFAGTIAMAVTQLLKELTPYRWRFQSEWMEQRLSKQIAASEVPEVIAGAGIGKLAGSKAVDDLVRLTTGGDRRALFSLEAEEVGRRMQDLTRILIDYPRKVPSLYFALTHNTESEDLLKLYNGQVPTEMVIDLRDRMARSIDANMSGIILSLCFRWRFLMQLQAVSITTLLVVGSVWIHSGMGAAAFAAPLGIVGGYFAPVMRDVVSAIESLRRR